GVIDGIDLGDESTVIPWVIAPRASLVSTPTPLIRWHALPGVKSYEITVRGEGVDWTTNDSAGGNESELELRYPAAAPPLQRGIYYRVIVNANGVESNEPGGLGGG